MVSDRLRCALAMALVLGTAGRIARADVFNMPAGQVSLSTVPVGNAGNANDASTGGVYGAVNYNYNISEYAVTSAQYCQFLNAVAAADTYGLWNSSMATSTQGGPGILRSGSSGSYNYSVVSGRENHPVNQVTYWDTVRFANWLNNGQGGPGTTETGAYTLNGVVSPSNTSITRNLGAHWAVPTESEWYKAAYYDPTLNSGAGGYWLYPTRSNTINSSMANYAGGPTSDTTIVGSYPYPSYYGTYDQGGNVWNWNEAIYQTTERTIRGGSFWNDPTNGLQSVVRYNYVPTYQYVTIGMRLVDLDVNVNTVPEPASLGFLVVGVVGAFGLSRRRK